MSLAWNHQGPSLSDAADCVARSFRAKLEALCLGITHKKKDWERGYREMVLGADPWVMVCIGAAVVGFAAWRLDTKWVVATYLYVLRRGRPGLLAVSLFVAVASPWFVAWHFWSVDAMYVISRDGSSEFVDSVWMRNETNRISLCANTTPCCTLHAPLTVERWLTLCGKVFFVVALFRPAFLVLVLTQCDRGWREWVARLGLKGVQLAGMVAVAALLCTVHDTPVVDSVEVHLGSSVPSVVWLLFHRVECLILSHGMIQLWHPGELHDSHFYIFGVLPAVLWWAAGALPIHLLTTWYTAFDTVLFIGSFFMVAYIVPDRTTGCYMVNSGVIWVCIAGFFVSSMFPSAGGFYYPEATPLVAMLYRARGCVPVFCAVSNVSALTCSTEGGELSVFLRAAVSTVTEPTTSCAADTDTYTDDSSTEGYETCSDEGNDHTQQDDTSGALSLSIDLPGKGLISTHIAADATIATLRHIVFKAGGYRPGVQIKLMSYTNILSAGPLCDSSVTEGCVVQVKTKWSFKERWARGRVDLENPHSVVEMHKAVCGQLRERLETDDPTHLRELLVLYESGKGSPERGVTHFNGRLFLRSERALDVVIRYAEVTFLARIAEVLLPFKEGRDTLCKLRLVSRRRDLARMLATPVLPGYFTCIVTLAMSGNTERIAELPAEEIVRYLRAATHREAEAVVLVLQRCGYPLLRVGKVWVWWDVLAVSDRVGLDCALLRAGVLPLPAWLMGICLLLRVLFVVLFVWGSCVLIHLHHPSGGHLTDDSSTTTTLLLAPTCMLLLLDLVPEWVFLYVHLQLCQVQRKRD